jgi:hypothetical protein
MLILQGTGIWSWPVKTQTQLDPGRVRCVPGWHPSTVEEFFATRTRTFEYGVRTDRAINVASPHPTYFNYSCRRTLERDLLVNLRVKNSQIVDNDDVAISTMLQSPRCLL